MSLLNRIPHTIYIFGTLGLIACAPLVGIAATIAVYNDKPEKSMLMEIPGEIRSEIYSLTGPSKLPGELPDLTEKVNGLLTDKTKIENSPEYLFDEVKFNKETKVYESDRALSNTLASYGLVLFITSGIAMMASLGGHQKYQFAKELRKDGEKSQQSLEKLV